MERTRVTIDLSAPQPDEIEVSVFGRGRGEALVIHLGGGRWATVDSFIDPDSRLPITLRYLQSLGVDIASVEFVVVTHWDKDHISGVVRLASPIFRTPNAASVVVALRGPMGDLLLGADLERDGWSAAMPAVLAQGLIARMFKVPHHGSEDADAPEVWANHLRSDALYAMTRFSNAERALPSDDDRARMRARNSSGHIVGQPPSRWHLHGVFGRRVRAGTRNGVWLDTGPVGHYRWRAKLSGEAADVSFAGPVEPV